MGAAAGQTSYGFANMYGSELCRARRAAGLPGLSIGWGPIGNVGVMAEADKVCSRSPNILAHMPLSLLLQAPALGQSQLSFLSPACEGTPDEHLLSTCSKPEQKHSSCSGQGANAFLRPLQNFGMRVFQLTAPQPVDEVLECLGDALSADQSKLPVIMGCSRLRNQDGGVSTANEQFRVSGLRG